MASSLSRLGQASISRSTALLRNCSRTRSLYAATPSRFFSRYYGPKALSTETTASLFRCRSTVTGFHHNCYAMKLKIGLCYASSAEDASHIVLEMPALSPTMSQGNIAGWKKKEGDKIAVGDVLCEIETDKATVEFESLEEGYLAKILALDNSKDVPVGQPIAVTVESQEDVETVKLLYDNNAKAKAERPLTQPITKGEIKEKKTRLIISPAAKLLINESGLDASLLIPSGPRGTLLKGDVLSAIKSGQGSSKAVASMKEQSLSPKDQTLNKTAVSSKASSYEDLPNSQIRKVIARRLLESKQTVPHLYLSTDVVLDPLLSFRKELTEKNNIKVSVNDIVIKAVAVALRNVPGANGVNFTDFNTHCCEVLDNGLLQTLVEVSRLGTSHPYTPLDSPDRLHGAEIPGNPMEGYWDAQKEEIVLNDSVDISVAVATEKGLITPIVRIADQKTISTISLEVKELAEKARTGKLQPNEFQGGTFCISNLGMFPVDHFCAIINPPQAGILAVGRGNKVAEPIVGTDGIEKPVTVTKMMLTLSADHRVFDGKVAGEFLSALRANFSDMRRLLL